MGFAFLFGTIALAAAIDAEQISKIIERLKKLGWFDKR